MEARRLTLRVCIALRYLDGTMVLARDTEDYDLLKLRSSYSDRNRSIYSSERAANHCRCCSQ